MFGLPTCVADADCEPRDYPGFCGIAGGIFHSVPGAACIDGVCPVPATPTTTPTPIETELPTPTDSPTPTASPTPSPEGINHFLCYQISRGRSRETVSLTTSEFGSTSAVVRRAQRLCAPANKEDEDPTAPADPDHLTGYSLRTQVPFGAQFDQVVVNQFGTLTVDLIPPSFLLVPTGKSTSGPPAGYTPAIDHFQCFRTVHARFKRSGIDVADQFGTRTVNVRRPTRLCVPVDKDGSGITDPSASLMCYRVSGKPRLNDTHVFTTNQFGDDAYDVGVVRELCVPSQLNPGGPTATPVATITPVATLTPSATDTPVETSTPEPTESATPEPTETATPEPTETATPEPTATATPEPTETATPEPTETATPEPTETATPEPTETGTPEPTPTSTPFCGNAEVEPGEDCDLPGSLCTNFRTCTFECICPAPACGDSFVDDGEQCDDGNTVACDGCSPTCQSEPSCDDGLSCTIDTCTPETGECTHQPDDAACDDGNGDTTDRCNLSCSGNPGCNFTTGCTNEEGGGCGCS